jgi:alkanesulfonate monooxygenase SsuD/methylene tetrahydromethanopterin reductase-like flavin-dependent oxidoreductase (luciferase family)
MNTLAAPSAARTLDTMPAHARLWVYKAPRDLGQAEQKLVRERGAAFTATWAAHGARLDACVDVLHNRFVTIAVDEEQARASGCSIDKSVAFIKQLEHDLNLMLTDRMVVVFEAGGKVQSCRLQELPALIRDGTLSGDTIVFDDLVGTVGELNERFRVPLRNSWMERFL